jgi:malonyl-CoA O-methyltransferase
MGSIYCPPMPAPAPSATRRALDERAVGRIVRRLSAAQQPPWLHAEVARRMAERLPVIRKQPQTVIEWNGWLGASDDLLRAAYPKAGRIVVEDDAHALQRSAQARRPTWAQRLRAGVGLDAGQGPAQVLSRAALAAGSGDLLWANMALQATGDPPALMREWHRALAVDGFLMCSTLGPGTLPELAEVYAEAGWGAPMAPFVDMHDLGDMLVHAGFADPVMDQEILTLTWVNPQAALAELRGLGGNAHPGRVAGLRTPRWLAALQAALARRTDAQGRVALRFEVVYGHAFRPVTKATVAAETSLSLDAMREMVRSSRKDPR